MIYANCNFNSLFY